MALSATHPLLEDLRWRGLVAQEAATERLAELLGGSATVYCGFDPTADSLHIGSLVPLLALARFQRAGHTPIALAGGGTGLIGDPSGRASERTLNTEETVEAYVQAIRGQLDRFLDFDAGALVVNNVSWLRDLGAIELLRDVGKHFPMGWMLGKESVRSRLDGDGISYTEFSYMVLQAYDFLHLSRTNDCLVQIGGSDQFGNITAGMELIRRADGRSAAGMTVPLVTKADGEKFGKTAEGAVWLDPAKTSPYHLYQFFINADDRDAGRYLRIFTFLDRPAIEELERAIEERPGQREAQRALAREMTVMVHGEVAWRQAVELSEALFGGGGLARFGGAELEDALASAPAYTLPAGGELPTYAELLVATGLARSNSDAQRLAAGGGLRANDRPVADVFARPAADDFVDGRVLVLQRGKRTHGLVTRAAG